MDLFLGALDCLDLEVSMDDENLTIKRQTNVGTISFDKLFKCDRFGAKKLIEQIYAMKVDSSRKKSLKSYSALFLPARRLNGIRSRYHCGVHRLALT